MVVREANTRGQTLYGKYFNNITFTKFADMPDYKYCHTIPRAAWKLCLASGVRYDCQPVQEKSVSTPPIAPCHLDGFVSMYIHHQHKAESPSLPMIAEVELL